MRPVHVVELTAAETHPLRRTVLRAGTASDVVEFDGDELATTFHLGVRAVGEIVAISTWIARPCPARPALAGIQLRGMATDPAHRGAGLGARLLTAGIARCAASGAELVWARARVTALEFYVRHGFTPAGPVYADPVTGLPHRDILLTIATPTPG